MQQSLCPLTSVKPSLLNLSSWKLLLNGENPIERLEVICSESQETVNLDIIPSGEQADFEAANGVIGVRGSLNASSNAMETCNLSQDQFNTKNVTEIEDYQVSKLAQLEN